jgi:hypothetical protein
MWTIGCAAMIVGVSLISIFSRHSSKHAPDNNEPALLADVVAQSATNDVAVDSATPKDFKVVRAVAIDSADERPSVHDDDRNAPAENDQFVEQNPGAVPAGNFRSQKYGYTVTLSGTRWARWNDLTAVMPDAEWGALLKNYGRFLVMPVQLADAETSPEEVDRALLARFGFQFPDTRSTDLETFQRWGAEGHVFRISRDIGGRENVYRIWILRRDRNAYLVAAWIDRTAAMNSQNGAATGGSNAAATDVPAIDGVQLDAEVDAQLEAVLNRFKLTDPAGTKDTSNDRRFLRHLLQAVSKR